MSEERTVISYLYNLYCSCRVEKEKKRVASRAHGLLVFLFDENHSVIGLKCEDCGSQFNIRRA